jgi:predicted metal-dependent phosphoesterase TrpH
MQADFHLHTHYSDGTWSPKELVEHAVRLKLTHIAITDHDTTDGINEAIEAAQGRLEIIAAVEINTIRQEPDGRHKDVHILGYFIDQRNKKLQNLLSRQRQARQNHIEKLVANLNAAGQPITMEMIRGCAGPGAIGKAHITQSMVDCGMAESIMEAYEKYVSKESPFYVARESVSPQEAIAAINDSGGFASIAHPGKSPKMLAYILDLKNAGLAGVEAFHRMHSVDLVRQYIRFANRHSLIVTGGSDCHGPYQEYKATAGSIALPKEIVKKFLASQYAVKL